VVLIRTVDDDDGRIHEVWGRRERGVAIATSQTRPSLPSLTTITANMHPSLLYTVGWLLKLSLEQQEELDRNGNRL
jgi:hypothetical protein